MALQIVGSFDGATGNISNPVAAEVEINTKALRTAIKSNDYASLGAYTIGHGSGAATSLSGPLTNVPYFAFRWGDASRLCLVRSVLVAFSKSAGTNAFLTANMFVARSWTVNDTGGVQILTSTATSNQNKNRTNMGASLATDIRASTNAALTAGTRTKDGQPLATFVFGVSGGRVGIGGAGLPLTPLFESRIGEHPLVFAQNEGFVLELNTADTGGYQNNVSVTWEELASY